MTTPINKVTWAGTEQHKQVVTIAATARACGAWVVYWNVNSGSACHSLLFLFLDKVREFVFLTAEMKKLITSITERESIPLHRNTPPTETRPFLRGRAREEKDFLKESRESNCSERGRERKERQRETETEIKRERAYLHIGTPSN